MKKLLLVIILLTAISGAVYAEYPAPERRKITLTELKASLYDNDGKVVEVIANRFSSFKQVAKGEYSVECRYYKFDVSSSGEFDIYFSGEDARDFFQDIIEDHADVWDGSEEDFYVYVDGKTLTAIGKRYSKSKKEYSW